MTHFLYSLPAFAMAALSLLASWTAAFAQTTEVNTGQRVQKFRRLDPQN